ncbi:MAG: tRNA (adenosine(37)-N6)-threonylcarbamoyltransferase complex ATPase subunit type 1 TsaE [Bacteroidia bacterium]|nr:tRNA (adenosine(37)-N6)-threonylcarbamoyltransferase complex ATPase subunit type 1 TsaE [Bacteroidia bacterium]
MPERINQTVLGESVKLEELDVVAGKLLSIGYPGVWCFHGGLGAGKTTLIKSICLQLGVVSAVTSPTFSIANEYLGQHKTKTYHFDCYRLKNETEAYDIGIDEYFESGQYCFVEWPELIPSLIPKRHIDIWMTVTGLDTRTVAYTKYE